MPNSTNHENLKSKVDRLAISATDCGVDKILGIAEIQSRTGKAQAEGHLSTAGTVECCS